MNKLPPHHEYSPPNGTGATLVWDSLQLAAMVEFLRSRSNSSDNSHILSHSSSLRPPIVVTSGIVLTKGGCNSALAVGGGRESKPWLIPAGKLSTAHHAQRPPPPGRGWPPWVGSGGRETALPPSSPASLHSPPREATPSLEGVASVHGVQCSISPQVLTKA